MTMIAVPQAIIKVINQALIYKILNFHFKNPILSTKKPSMLLNKLNNFILTSGMLHYLH